MSPRTILFFIKSLRFLRYFKSVVEALLRREYAVHIVFDASKIEPPADDSLEEFKKQYPRFSWENGPLRSGMCAGFVVLFRNLRNYAFIVRITSVKRHRARMAQFIPRALKRLFGYVPLMERIFASRAVDRLFALCERAVSSDKKITAYIRAHRPFAVLVSYRNFPCTSPDTDYVKSAKSLGIPVAIITPSWDHLTTKSLIHIKPDAMFVWNEEHAQALRAYHHIPQERIKITGAPQFDVWFNRRAPFQERTAFAASFGLDAQKKFLLYISSASAGTRNPEAIRLLRAACDASVDPVVRNAHLLVRPYPGYEAFSRTSEISGVTVLPAPADGRRTLRDDALFYDSIFHSFAVAALDSAAFFDVMAIGRPGIVYRDARFTDIQSAEHFSALMEHGALYEVFSPRAFTETLAQLLSGKDALMLARAAYLARFIRPHGVGTDAGEVVAEELEKLV